MPKRSRTEKRPKDVNQLAHYLVDRSTEESGAISRSEISRVMSEMGRKGGKKGGRARAEKLTPAERRASALKAARARWDKKSA